MGKTIISWATHTWTPVTGCSRVDRECEHCYAESLSLKRGWSALPWTERNAAANVILHPDRLRAPLSYPAGSRVFLTSMGDIFHREVPDDFLRRIFEVMRHAKHHRFMVLTKRPERMAEWPGPWLPHIWAGTTVGHRGAKALRRLEDLRRTPAQIRFISAEPLLEDLGAIDLTGIHQVLVGGESGSGYRPMNMAWARSLRDRCVESRVAYFHKQDAAYQTETRCYLVEEDGSAWEWHQWPDDLRPPKRVQPDNPKYHREHFPIHRPVQS
jgi:protein gp37